MLTLNLCTYSNTLKYIAVICSIQIEGDFDNTNIEFLIMNSTYEYLL